MRNYFFILYAVRLGIVVIVVLVLATSAVCQLSAVDSLLVSQTDFVLPPDSLFTVHDVVIVGNEKTKPYVLSREMTLKEGDAITAEAVEYDKKRIYSLGLFTRVEIGYIPLQPPAARLVILVSERWYLYPFPLIGIKDRDWSKLYFGGGVTHQNFRGRNEKLYVALTVGYDPTVIFLYRNPLIDAENNYFLNAGFRWNVIRNRSLLAIGTGQNFDERHLSLSLDIGKRIDLAHILWLSSGYEIVEVTDHAPGRTFSSDGTDAFPFFGVGYTYDTRDLAEYTMYGSFVRATITKYGVPSGTVDFVRYALDFRRFVPLTSQISLAGRFFGDLSAAGQIPTYNRTYLGYNERVRGHFSEIYEGEQQLGVSGELRFMVMEPRYVTVGFIPVPEFAVWKFGVAAALFGDAAMVWFRNSPFVLQQFVKGYGVGLHIILPYGFVLRTEYALNEIRQGEFILDFSAAF